MAKKIVAIYDRGIDKDIMQGFSVLEAYGFSLVLVEKTVDEDELAYQNSMLSVEVNGPDKTPINPAVFDEIRDAEIIITHFAPVSRAMIEAAPDLKIIGTLRTGMENINLEAANERGIQVINAPGRAAVAVADFTVAAMICEMRNIARTDADIKAGRWTKKFANIGYADNMCNCTVGLVGFGDIGRKIAKRLQGFDTKVLAYDPYCPDERIREAGGTPVDFDTLLRESDFISLHVRLSPETHNMFGAAEFAKMKPTAIFVNEARAGLVDESAMLDALQNKRIGGAVLDVFHQEPLPADHPLRSMDNVTLSAHLAGTDKGTFSGSVSIVADDLKQYFEGNPLKHVVNRKA